MTPEETTHVIQAARQIGSLISSLGDVSLEANRLHLTHEQLKSTIRTICDQHRTSVGSCFSDEQVDCIHQIVFQLFCILDPKTKPPETAFGALWREIAALSVLKKFGLVAGFLAAFASLIAIVDGGKSLIFGDKKAEQRGADPQTKGLSRGASLN